MPARSRSRRPAALHSVFERTFHEQRRSLMVWTAGLFVLAVTMAALYPTIRGNRELSNLYESYPKALRSLFGIADLTTGIGYLRAELFSLVVPLLLIVLAVLWGGDMIAGEEDRGTMDILMANPISRRRVVCEKWGALGMGIVMVAAGLTAGLVVGVLATGMHVKVVGLAAAVVSTTLLGVLFGSIALAVGAATGRRGAARGTAAALAVLAYLVSSLADLVAWLEPIRPLSPWYHALGVDPLTTGFSLLHIAVLVGLILLAGAVAVVTFDRRDLAV